MLAAGFLGAACTPDAPVATPAPDAGSHQQLGPKDSGSVFCDPTVETCSFPQPPAPGCVLTEDLTWECPDASLAQADAGRPGQGCVLNADLEWECPDASQATPDAGPPGPGCVLNEDSEWGCPDASEPTPDAAQPRQDSGVPRDGGVIGPDASTPTDGGTWSCTVYPTQDDGCGCDACVPGTFRYCDEPVYCSWGRQECMPDGTWGVCYEIPSHPGTCLGEYYDAECCYIAGECCQDPNNGGSWGNCGGICEAM